MQKVLVTGADGFIGSHLVEALLYEGWQVKAFVYYNSFNSWGWLDTFPKSLLQEIEVFAGDVRDPHGVRAAMQNCQTVFHLAALIGIPFSYHSPDSYVDTNIKGTLNILQACRDLEVEKVLITSTSEVYGTAQYVPIDERHPLQGQSPYSATKIGADKLAEAFFRSFELPVTVVRPFNTYGPRQSARAIIPTIITQILAGCPAIKLGNLSPSRDFVFVKDTAQGFLEIAKSTHTIGETIHIATGKEISMRKLVDTLKQLLASHVQIVTDGERIRPQDSEVERLVGKNDKLVSLTGWQPQYDLEDGLQETIAWFKEPANFQRYKPELYNV